MTRRLVLACPALAATALLAGCSASAPSLDQYGTGPQLPPQERGLLPDMTIAEPASWGGKQPLVPPGYRISAIAMHTNTLRIDRNTLAGN